MLMSPIVVGPVTPCNDSVRVRGQFANAAITIEAAERNTRNTRLVAQGTATSPDEFIPLVADLRLRAGELLTASQHGR